MYKFHKLASILTVLAILLLYPNNALAQGPAFDPGSGGRPVTVDEAVNSSFDCIYTAFGCFPLGDTNTLTANLIVFGVGLASGVAILMIVYASFMIMTSQGVPQRLQNGKTILFASLSGLLLIIFSTLVMRFVGIGFLGLF